MEDKNMLAIVMDEVRYEVQAEVAALLQAVSEERDELLE